MGKKDYKLSGERNLLSLALGAVWWIFFFFAGQETWDMYEYGLKRA